eukprot:13630046-Alexandrium_andersonii.AAC.1
MQRLWEVPMAKEGEVFTALDQKAALHIKQSNRLRFIAGHILRTKQVDVAVWPRAVSGTWEAICRAMPG